MRPTITAPGKLGVIFIILGLLNCCSGNPIVDLIQDGTPCAAIIAQYVERVRRQSDRIKISTVGSLTTAENLDIYVEQNNGTLFGPLHCIPFVVGPFMDVAALPTLPGHPVLNESIPQTHAEAVKTLMDAGAVLIGKIDYSRDENAAELVSRAVEADMVEFGLLLDYDGSAISAGSNSGLLTFRPTWTRISTEGTLPFSQFSDAIAIVAKSTMEIAKALTILDPASKLSRLAGYLGADVLNADGMGDLTVGSLGIPAKNNDSALENETEKFFAHKNEQEQSAELFTFALGQFEASGADIQPIDTEISGRSTLYLNLLDKWEELSACQPSWLDAYFGSKLRFPAQTSPFSTTEDVEKFVKTTEGEREILAESQAQRHLCPVRAEEYIEAQKEFDREILEPMLKNLDVLAFPIRFEFSKSTGSSPGKNPYIRGLDLDQRIESDPLGILPPITGYPAITIPIGRGPPLAGVPNGLPVGMTLIAAPRNMHKLITAAYAYKEIYGEKRENEELLNEKELLKEDYSKTSSAISQYFSCSLLIVSFTALWYF